jgi:hypothetical protein
LLIVCSNKWTPSGYSTLSTAYERDQPASIVLKNIEKKSVRVYCNLEVVDEQGKWITWPFRAEDGKPGAMSKIYPLNPGDSTKVAFDIRKVVLPPIPAGQRHKLAEQLKFRFRIVVLHAGSDDRESEFFSRSFVIRHPYGQ